MPFRHRTGSIKRAHETSGPRGRRRCGPFGAGRLHSGQRDKQERIHLSIWLAGWPRRIVSRPAAPLSSSPASVQIVGGHQRRWPAARRASLLASCVCALARASLCMVGRLSGSASRRPSVRANKPLERAPFIDSPALCSSCDSHTHTHTHDQRAVAGETPQSPQARLAMGRKSER